MNLNNINNLIHTCFDKTLRFYATSNSTTIYNNIIKEKCIILKNNRGRCGVYKWTNKINGKIYIGSSTNLGLRISNYLSINYLSKRIEIYKSKIYNAMLYYGYDNFSLEILEYCDKSSVINKEQYYINKYNPEYNILTKAGSSIGFKHSKETLAKFKLRKLSTEALIKLKKSKIGANLSPLTKNNQLLSVSHKILVKDVYTSNIIEFASIRKTAKEFKVSHSTIINYLDKNKIFKDKYIIVRKVKK